MLSTLDIMAPEVPTNYHTPNTKRLSNTESHYCQMNKTLAHIDLTLD